MSKYGNRKVTVDGISFDSKKEARRYTDLMLLARAGEISNLERQVKFVLVPAQYEVVERYGKDGRRLRDAKKLIERECAYIADFTYTDSSGKYVVEDTKGMRTKDYIIKRKLMLHRYGIRVREV